MQPEQWIGFQVGNWWAAESPNSLRKWLRNANKRWNHCCQGWGDKLNPAAVPDALRVELRSRSVSIFQMSESAVNPRPGGLFPRLVQALTEATQDPGVHIHN